MGLTISPEYNGTRHRVNEYLRQAGFPLRYIPELTEKMLSLSKSVGIPDDNDTAAIEQWQDLLIEKLKYPFTKIGREAIERDDNGYYIRLFIRLLTSPARDDSKIEQSMKAAIEQSGKTDRSSKKLAFPQILFQDLEVGVLLPACAAHEWKIIEDGESRSFQTDENDRFIPFNSDLPKRVEIEGASIHIQKKIWEDDSENRFLIFSELSGKFYQGGSLAQDKIEIPPGQYTLLLRFEPDNFTRSDIECLRDDPSLFMTRIQLAPGEELTLYRGPAQISISGFDQPTLNFRVLL